MVPERTFLVVCCLALLCLTARSQDTLETRMVAAHNSYRAKAGTPPLDWSSHLANEAQKWANLLVAQDLYKPRRDGRYGENLFEIVGGRASEGQVVGAWAAEVSHYNRRTNMCSGRCGHYTQVVWHDTERVGCGVARNRRREVWVCNYDPPGNIVGERPY